VKRLEIFLLTLLLLAALFVRLYKIGRPIGDWHSWRQADTAAVARNFIKEGYNPFIPRYDDMSSQTNALANPNRYRFVEFPIYNSLIAGVWYFTGVYDIYARLTTVVISLFSILLLYLIVKKYSGIRVAFLAAFFFAFIPYNIFYSTAVLPAPFMVFSLLLLYWAFDKWLEDTKKWSWYVIAAIAANVAILSWPIALIFTLPPIYLAFKKFGMDFVKKPSLWVFAFIAIAPFGLWRLWMSKFPEGIPNWQFLINEGNIRFKGAFFRWIFQQRLGQLILTVGGIPLLVLGLIKKPGREGLYYLAFLASSLIYITIFASGNVRHDYYQIPIIPSLSIFMAIGTNFLLSLPKDHFSRYVGPIIAVVCLGFLFAFGFYEIRGYYWINKPQIVEAGRAVDQLLPKDATVIAPYNGDTAFLYQTNRHGYPIVDRPLEKLIKEGTKYLVSVDPNDAGISNLAKNCKVIKQTNDYVIIKMTTACVSK
jgi:4-amino-4-deoxy-L-arabinose transferase-like glycosyltransferase